MSDVVWQKLLTEDYIAEAELILAAAVGADTNPDVLLQEMTRQSEKLIELKDDAEAIADRWVRLLAAVSALSLTMIRFMATNVAQVQDGLSEDEEPDPEKVRHAALVMLANCTSDVREWLEDEPQQ